MTYARLAQRLYGVPLLVTADKLDVLDHVLRAYEEGRAKLLSPYEKKERPELALEGAPQLTRAGYIRTAQGVAIIPILGTLVQRTSGMDAESGLTSYAAIGSQIDAAMNDSLTRGVLLEVDSQGGEANGIFDLADDIRAASGVKPVFSHANELALSGGYVLASAAEEMYAARTGMVGSVGVRMRHVDQSQYDAKRGFVYTDVIAGDRKADGSPHAPLSDPARQWMQDHVDRTYAVFVDHVTRMRGMSEQDVRGTQAAMIHADAAATLGLIDGVETINDTMRRLIARINEPQTTYGMRAAARASVPAPSLATTSEGATMANEQTFTAAQVAEAEARAAAKARSEVGEEFAKKLTSLEGSFGEREVAAATAAQTRIATIIDSDEAKGREALARHLAFKTQSSAEDAIATLKAAPKDGGAPTNLLAEKMRNTNPNVAADAGGEGEETEAAVVARIMNAGKGQKLAAVK